jgi:ABC-type nitrate/sulfonate/bicarbonate transport system substrate-binding protein
MNLGAGGDAITISKRLFDAGVRSATSLGKYMRSDSRQEVLSFGHVFGCSMHHYLLRDWLATGHIHPDTDVRLRVFPPNQMAAHLERGSLDSFCVGEPWNTLAEQAGHGRIVALTADILPNHPEKILVVTRQWMNAHESILPAVIRAILRACAYCEDENNYESLTELLSRREYLNTPSDIIRKSLSLDRTLLERTSRGGARKSDWCVRSFSPASTFPSKMHSAWLASEMIRWNHLPAHVDVRSLANGCADSSAYRRAAESLGIDCPPTDFPIMHIRTGIFDPLDRSIAEGARHEI